MTERAFIRESECIGCTKCLAVCPTDAIVGANNFLHTIIEQDCIGCERCVPVCPVDCIDLLPMRTELDPTCLDHDTRLQRKAHFQFLAQRRKTRLRRKEEEAKSFFLEMRNKMRGLS